MNEESPAFMRGSVKYTMTSAVGIPQDHPSDRCTDCGHTGFDPLRQWLLTDGHPCPNEAGRLGYRPGDTVRVAAAGGGNLTVTVLRVEQTPWQAPDQAVVVVRVGAGRQSRIPVAHVAPIPVVEPVRLRRAPQSTSKEDAA